MNRTHSIILLFLLMIVSAATAQIRVVAPSKVAVGEQFRLQYVVSTTDVKGFRAGNIPDAFEVLMGPSTSTQQSFQMINGRTTSSSSVTYTYILSAEKNGTYTISGAKARVDGKDVTSQPVTITISGKAQSPQRQQGGGMQSQRGAQVRPSGSHISGNDLFIKVSANKQRVHEQEPILLTYKVYTQVELTQLEGKMPDLTGFHTQEVELPRQKSFHIESLNGRPYRCVTWSQYVMYPQMTGKLEIPSITFKGIVVQENGNVDPFEAFFNGGSAYVEVKKEIKAPSLTIQVDPLPAKPANFSGGVGHFNISATQDKTTVKSGDPLKIRITVSGNGNLKLIKQPEISVPSDFDKYDAKVTDKTKLTAQGLEGSMIYEFLVVPHNQGDYEIPGVEFVYFDTQSNSFKTIKTSAIKVKVEKGSGRTTSVSYNEEDTDIHTIHQGASQLTKPEDHFFGSTLYVIVNALVIIIFLTLLIVFRKRAMELANVTALKGKRANKIANKRLKKSATLMKQGKSSAFYDEVLRALWGYVSDKLSIHVSELSRENISERLALRNVDTETIASFIEAIDECEFERYAPGDTAGNMQKTYEKAVSAITNIEDAMKQKNKKSAAKGMVVLLITLFSMPAFAIDKQNADAAYLSGDYQKAVSSYKEILKEGESADIYFNLGNAYYRSNDIKNAVLNYRRALLFAPGDKDIIHNLIVAQNKTPDRISSPDEMLYTTWYESVIGLRGFDGWAHIALYSLILSLILFLVYLFAEKMFLRQISFYVSGLLLIVFLLSNIFAWHLHYRVTKDDGAVVMVESASVLKAPVKNSQEAFAIHEGTYVEIIDDTLKGWLQVKLQDGREGWIAPQDVEKVR